MNAASPFHPGAHGQENLLLNDRDRVKLIDFGLAGQIRDCHGRELFLETQCGSESYAAPEVINGRAYDGMRADVWSLGVVLYAMVCGHLPFECDDVQGLYDLVCAGRYELPETVSPPCAGAIAACLCVDPSRRASIETLQQLSWLRTVGIRREDPEPDRTVFSSLVLLFPSPPLPCSCSCLTVPYTRRRGGFPKRQIRASFSRGYTASPVTTWPRWWPTPRSRSCTLTSSLSSRHRDCAIAPWLSSLPAQPRASSRGACAPPIALPPPRGAWVPPLWSPQLLPKQPSLFALRFQCTPHSPPTSRRLLARL